MGRISFDSSPGTEDDAAHPAKPGEPLWIYAEILGKLWPITQRTSSDLCRSYEKRINQGDGRAGSAAVELRMPSTNRGIGTQFYIRQRRHARLLMGKASYWPAGRTSRSFRSTSIPSSRKAATYVSSAALSVIIPVSASKLQTWRTATRPSFSWAPSA